MSGLSITQIFLFTLVGLVWAYDAIIVLRKGWDYTISKTMYDVSHRNPIIPFLVGLVCGHFFWGITG